MRKLNLILLGAPGAGKGTQAEIISERYGIPAISTGAMIREAIASGSELGKKVKSYTEKGDLVPDDVVIHIIKERMAKDDCANGFILDGFPRTVPQAEALDEFAKLDAVINLEVANDLLVHRLSGRRVCAACGYTTHVDRHEDKCVKCGGELSQRKDDAPESVQNRLNVYEKQTKPLTEYYEAKGLLRTVDGAKPLDEVTAEILSALGC